MAVFFKFLLLLITSILVICMFVIYMPALEFTTSLTPKQITIIREDFKPDGYYKQYLPYEDGLKNCSVKAVQSKEEIYAYLTRTNPDNLKCNWDYFKNHYRKQVTDAFFSEGIWFAPKSGNASVKADFFPKGCSFGRNLASSKSLVRCFRKNNISKILITGDSNARFLTEDLVNFLTFLAESTGGSCTDNLEDITDLNISKYYGTPEVPADIMRCTQRGFGEPACGFYEYKFTFKESSTDEFIFNVQYIPFIHFLDSTLVLRFGNGTYPENPKGGLGAETKLEYILKYYLPYVGFPDLWLFAAPFHHEVWAATLEKLKLDIEYALSLMDMYLPNTTQIAFMSDARECRKYQMNVIAQHFKHFWGTEIINYRIHNMNQLLFKIMRDRFINRPNYHGFLDGVRVSCPLECTWHEDGAHMVPIWYTKMARYILELFCAW